MTDTDALAKQIVDECGSEWAIHTEAQRLLRERIALALSQSPRPESVGPLFAADPAVLNREPDVIGDSGSAGAPRAMREGTIYVASRASIPERAAMWRQLRSDGWQITSSWIDEAGDGETDDFTELWDRITREISAAAKLVFYAEQGDFPLKGAILEAGIALGMGKPVIVCLPGVKLEGSTHRPLGSWLKHRNVIRVDWLADAMAYYGAKPALHSPRPKEAEIGNSFFNATKEGTTFDDD